MKPTIKSIETRYGGRLYRSRVEARWAIFFDCCGIRFEYEHEGFPLPSGPYLPDFWLPDFRLFLEIKGGEPTDEERLKCSELAQATECPVLLAEGAPDERFQIHWFDQAGEEEEDVLYAIASDARIDGSYWLVASDVSRWMGGGNPASGEVRGGPRFSGAIERAYGAALSARFAGKMPRFEVIREEHPTSKEIAA